MSGTPRLDGAPDGSPFGDPVRHAQGQYPPQAPHLPQGQYPPQEYLLPQGQYPQPPFQPGWPPAYPIAPSLPKPGSMPIGPNDFGAAFGSTFGTFGTMWKPILVAVAPAMAATAIVVTSLGTVIGRLSPTIGNRLDTVDSVSDFIRAVPHLWAMVAGASLGYALIGIYALAVIAGTARSAGRAITGDRVPATHIVRSGARALPRVLTWVAVCAVPVVVVAALGLLAFVASSETSQRIAYFGILALVVAIVGSAVQIVFVLKLEFLIPAMMLEPRSADPATGVVTSGPSRPLGLIHAARRSWTLTTGRVWRTFGITLLMSVLVSAGPAVVNQIVNVATSVVTTASRSAAVFVIAYAVYFTLVVGLNLIAVMVQTIAQTVLYTDARIRDEGVAPAILDHAETGSPADPWVRWHERY